MSTVGAVEAKERLSELLDLVERGEEIVITRHGRPVATLAPAHAQDVSRDGETGGEHARAALERLGELRRRLRSEGVFFPAEEILSLRDEGRR